MDEKMTKAADEPAANKTPETKTAQFYKWKDKRLYGRLGPASRVRRIDPKTGEVLSED